MANARAAVIANYYGNTAEIIATAYSQAAYEIAQVSLWSIQAVHDSAVAVIYGTAEAHAWNVAQHLFADAAERNTNAQAAAAVALIAQEAAAAESHANAAHAAAVSLTAQTAAADHLAADLEAEHRRDRRQADAATDELAAWGTADAAYDREIDHWWDVVDAAEAHANEEKFWATLKMGFKIVHLKAAATLDVIRIHWEINIRTDKVKTAADQDETLAVQAEKHKKSENVDKFRKRVETLKYTDSMDAVFESGIWTVGVNSYLLNEGLDIGSNFVAGWADGLTAGYHSKLRDLLGINHFIDTSSGAYGLGQITGVVHSVIMGVASGGPHVGWAYTAARFHTAALTLASMIESGPKIWHDATTNEPREATAWDYLNMVPAVGYIFGKLTKGAGIFSCFVGNTEVAIGWQEPQLAAMEIPADLAEAQWNQEWLIGGTGAMLLLTTWKIASNRRKDKRQQRLEDNYFTDRVFDDLHTSMLPPRPELEHESALKARDRAEDICLPAAHEQTEETKSSASPLSTLDSGLSTSRLSTSRRWTFSQRATALVTASLLFLAGFCFWQSAPSSFTGPKEKLALASITAPQPERQLLTKPIQEIRVGERVVAHNPELSDAERQNAIEPDPETWRHLSLRLQKPDNSFVEIEMLRPMEWVLAHNASRGSTIHLDLEEIGASGNALVLNIGSCPPIDDGDGQVVTATFSHTSSDVVDLYVEGLDKPIGVTTNHRFWSEDRHEFLAVADLREGESLRLAYGRIAKVQQISESERSKRVFNLEVNQEHVYLVSSAGILTHNTYPNTRTGFGPFGWGKAKTRNVDDLIKSGRGIRTDVNVLDQVRALTELAAKRDEKTFIGIMKIMAQSKVGRQQLKRIHDKATRLLRAAESNPLLHRALRSVIDTAGSMAGGG